MKLLKNKIVLGIGICALLFIFAYVFVFLFFPAKKEEQQVKKQVKTLHAMPSLIANLSGSGGKRYLKVTITIEYYSKKVDTVKQFLSNKQVLLTDVLLMLLSSKTVATIDGYENKKLLKEEIKQKFNQIVFQEIEGEISNIYFTTFLVQ